jgi:hypothetical protein
MTDHLETVADAETAARDAARRGAFLHRLDGKAMVDKASALAAIAAALSFPDHFGHNLDALFDMAGDLSWLPEGEHVLLWTDSAVLRDGDPAAWRGVRSALSDAVARTEQHTRRLRVQLVQD